MSTNEIQWQSWQPRERAVLCFVLRENRILLIRKKRGLGAGKINGPGGRMESGETPVEAAVRETGEEVGVIPLQLDMRGELFFQFRDGYSLHCSVFTALDSVGKARESDEADPFWKSFDEIPFEEMWHDDALWLQGMISGGKFRGYFLFDGDYMLEQRVIWDEAPKHFLFDKLFNTRYLQK